MRNVVLSSICAAAIGLSTVGGAFAQTSGGTAAPGAPASNQTNVTGPAAGKDTAGMDSMNKMKKKKTSKSKMQKGDMEKKM
jgi:hypothetical protein